MGLRASRGVPGLLACWPAGRLVQFCLLHPGCPPLLVPPLLSSWPARLPLGVQVYMHPQTSRTFVLA